MYLTDHTLATTAEENFLSKNRVFNFTLNGGSKARQRVSGEYLTEFMTLSNKYHY